MKKLWLACSLLTVSLPLFALHCGHLGITIINETKHDCTLRASRKDYGYFQNQVPITIAPNSSSQTFYMAQDFVGIGIQLDYRCNNKIAMFYSGQGLCTYIRGHITGFSYYLSDLSIEHQIELGNYWSEQPGQITWRIH